MAQFRKRPVVVEAVRYGPYSAPSVALMIHLEGCPAFEFRDGALFIETLEGTHRADVGDWIIKGVAGEFYPCKPDIFAVTYEPASVDTHPQGGDAHAAPFMSGAVGDSRDANTSVAS